MFVMKRSEFDASTGAGTAFVRTSHRMAMLAACACFLLLITSSTVLMAQIGRAGRLDTGFGNGGVFLINPGTEIVVGSVALQSTGKIIVGGSANARGALVRVNTNGTLDTTFGSGGVVTNNFGIVTSVTVLGLAVQPDDKILAVATGLPQGLVIGRFNSNGSVDTSFGNQGFTTNISNCQPGFAASVALQPDGQVLESCALLLARVTTTGQFDTTFGNAGVTSLKGTSFNVNAIAVQTDGRILIASTGIGGQGIVSRYNSNGTVDASYGILGQAGSIAGTSGLALQGDGRVAVAGDLITTVSPVANGFGVIRFNPDGSVDTNFGSHGGVATGFPGLTNAPAAAILQQSNGNLVVAGSAFNQLSSSEFALARYTSSGALDLGFGTGGRVLTSFGSNAGSITAMTLQSDGKIVVVGTVGSNFAVARYLSQ
jgi:uncharacterized delta-60 repeat protein